MEGLTNQGRCVIVCRCHDRAGGFHLGTRPIASGQQGGDWIGPPARVNPRRHRLPVSSHRAQLPRVIVPNAKTAGTYVCFTAASSRPFFLYKFFLTKTTKNYSTDDVVRVFIFLQYSSSIGLSSLLVSSAIALKATR